MSLTTPPAARPRPEVLALLAEVKDRPDDDAPRLLLADWLEKHDDPRGEFVRLQVTRARLSPRDPRRAVLEQREQELLGRFRDIWLGPLRTLLVPCKFERGLVHIAVHAAGLLAARGAEAGPSEAFAWIDGLTCIAALSAASVETLAASSSLLQLNELHLNAARLGPRGAARLAGLPTLARLTALYLWWGEIGPAGATALAASPHLSNLRTLHLPGHRIGPDGAAALARSPHLTRLTVLRLSHNDLGPDGAAALADSPVLAEVADLSLGENRIGTEGAKALADSPYLTRLSALHLNDATIGPAGAAALRARFGFKLHLSCGPRSRPTEPADPRWWKALPVFSGL